LNPTTLLQFFDSHRERTEPLVLVTVYDTTGSTYSKAGAQMLVNASGVFRGMLSGGCLEGDLAIRAQQVLESQTPQTVTYDLGQGDDELWGMGVGCDGLMRMQLQPLLPKDEYAPFAEIARILGGNDAQEVRVPLVDGSNSALTILVEPPPQILVLGAGLDAEPVVRFAAELGWRCTVVDHRKAYIDNGDFAAAVATCCTASNRLSDALDLDQYDMAVVMSHHLASDRDYLMHLADTSIAYIGLLGPPNRRERLVADLGAPGRKLEGRLYGPAGILIGGRGPAAIALSIVAQMQQKLSAS
jgi:xanthine/CO dehydrogenase XdhC/CoxF family maturation factor